MVIGIPGWKRPEHTIRRQRLLRWLVESERRGVQGVAGFYSLNGFDASSGRSDVESLASDGYVNDVSAYGSPMVILQGPGKEAVKAWDTDFERRRPREVACRVALLDWLVDVDATVDANEWAGYADFFGDYRSWFFGRQFSPEDVHRAASSLRAYGLLAGDDLAEEANWPEPAQVTWAGVRCVEKYDGDVSAFLDAIEQPSAPAAPTKPTSITVNATNVNLATGDHSQQTINVGAKAEELREVVRGIATIIGRLGWAEGLEEEVDEATEEGLDGVDPENLKPERARRWFQRINNLTATVQGSSQAVAAVNAAAGSVVHDVESLAHAIGSIT